VAIWSTSRRSRTASKIRCVLVIAGAALVVSVVIVVAPVVADKSLYSHSQRVKFVHLAHCPCPFLSVPTQDCAPMAIRAERYSGVLLALLDVMRFYRPRCIAH